MDPQPQRLTFFVKHYPEEEDEPQRKKRCVRAPSDISTEDISLPDSGFGDGGEKFQNGGGDLSLSELPEVIVGVDVVDDSSVFKHPEESQSNLSSNSDPCSSGVRSCSRSSSVIDNTDQDEDDDDDALPIDDNFIDLVLNSKEISSNPSKTAMMQRFFSHLKNNPNNTQLQHFLSLILSGPEFALPRQRLRHVTTIQDAARLLKCSKRILVLTGAGISVSCGIPDFRSKDGLYARVSKVFPDLRDPQSVFDIRLFRKDPRPFFLTAKELYPGQFQPSLSHKFIQTLENRGQLLRNYSQNIDTLETIAGIKKVTMCHGSFATATCIRCRHQVSADEIKDKVLSGAIPYCRHCSTEEEVSQIRYPLGQPIPRPSTENRLNEDEDEEVCVPVDSFPLPPVVKPDIVFFGEDLPDEFHNNLQQDKPICDLVVVIGSSLRVRPVSLIPGMVPAEIPQILINRESLPHCRFDVELLGNCDHIIAQLCKMMGSNFLELTDGPELREIDKLPKAASPIQEEIREPTSEHDIQALKACWEPKTNEKLVDRLPADSFLNWRNRQYIFEGSEEVYDPDDEEDEDDDSSSSSGSSSSCSSLPPDENRDKEIEEDLQLAAQGSETSVAPLPTELNLIDDKSK